MGALIRRSHLRGFNSPVPFMRDTMNENENTENAAPGKKGGKKIFLRSREPVAWFKGEPYYLLLLAEK